MRQITDIIVHCSATIEGHEYNKANIDIWHRQRGFRCIGYHYVVLLDGRVQVGRPLEQAGAHCQGHNQHTIGICYIGGLDKHGKPKDTRTPAQRAALRSLITQLTARFHCSTHGHRDFAAKDCPCFDAYEEYGDILQSIIAAQSNEFNEVFPIS